MPGASSTRTSIVILFYNVSKSWVEVQSSWSSKNLKILVHRIPIAVRTNPGKMTSPHHYYSVPPSYLFTELLFIIHILCVVHVWWSVYQLLRWSCTYTLLPEPYSLYQELYPHRRGFRDSWWPRGLYLYSHKFLWSSDWTFPSHKATSLLIVLFCNVWYVYSFVIFGYWWLGRSFRI